MYLNSSYYLHFLRQMVLQHFKTQWHWLFIHLAYLRTQKILDLVIQSKYADVK